MQIELCQPEALHIMDGSLDEDQAIKAQLVENGVLHPLKKYDNCFLARTDPKVKMIAKNVSIEDPILPRIVNYGKSCNLMNYSPP